jgi:hypothetical protein
MGLRGTTELGRGVTGVALNTMPFDDMKEFELCITNKCRTEGHGLDPRKHSRRTNRGHYGDMGEMNSQGMTEGFQVKSHD